MSTNGIFQSSWRILVVAFHYAVSLSHLVLLLSNYSTWIYSLKVNTVIYSKQKQNESPILNHFFFHNTPHSKINRLPPANFHHQDLISEAPSPPYTGK
jgi:hypothetical protein